MDEQIEFIQLHIVLDPAILHGKPTIQGTRVPVSLILNLLAHGESFADIVHAYPYVTEDDIRASLLYASARMNQEEMHGLAL
jgi:uncharacterized protein (DUF433 family)